MSNLTEEQLNNIDFNDDETVCPTCGAFGVFIPPSKVVEDTIQAKFQCHNGHFFTKRYPLKGDSEK